jgi:hypothetical protein
MQCRNCGSEDLGVIPDGGFLAPFFAYRVYGIRQSCECVAKLRETPKVRFLNSLAQGALEKISLKSIYVDSSSFNLVDTAICNECCFWSTAKKIDEELLNGLYLDYRSNAYNQDRERFEPGYAIDIAPFLGGHDESASRVSALDHYLGSLSKRLNLDLDAIESVLDWGGADGRFMPSLFSRSRRYTYEISDAEPVHDVQKLASLPEFSEYDFIQVAHVLEHVSHPFDFLKKPISHLAPRGLLYLEVPLECNPSTVLQDARHRLSFCIHEHMNRYTPTSLEVLVSAHGLKVLDSSEDEIDVIWCKAKILRLVARRPDQAGQL